MLKLIGTYGPRVRATLETGLAYADYLETTTGESWYTYADNKAEWENKGLCLVTDSVGVIVQNELEADKVCPADGTAWLLEGATERFEFDPEYVWVVQDDEVIKVPRVIPFDKGSAIDKANAMIGLYEDLNDEHAEADWRNYRIKAFNWVAGDVTPKEPIS